MCQRQGWAVLFTFVVFASCSAVNKSAEQYVGIDEGPLVSAGSGQEELASHDEEQNTLKLTLKIGDSTVPGGGLVSKVMGNTDEGGINENYDAAGANFSSETHAFHVMSLRRNSIVGTNFKVPWQRETHVEIPYSARELDPFGLENQIIILLVRRDRSELAKCQSIIEGVLTLGGISPNGDVIRFGPILNLAVLDDLDERALEVTYMVTEVEGSIISETNSAPYLLSGLVENKLIEQARRFMRSGDLATMLMIPRTKCFTEDMVEEEGFSSLLLTVDAKGTPVGVEGDEINSLANPWHAIASYRAQTLSSQRGLMVLTHMFDIPYLIQEMGYLNEDQIGFPVQIINEHEPTAIFRINELLFLPNNKEPIGF